MLAASVIAIFFIPVSYEVVERLTEKLSKKKKEAPVTVPAPSHMEGDKP
jgi:hypothetical protein